MDCINGHVNCHETEKLYEISVSVGDRPLLIIAGLHAQTHLESETEKHTSESKEKSAVMMAEGGLLDSLEGVKEEIIRQKVLYDKLIEEQAQLLKTNSEREQRTKEFKDRFVKITERLEQDKEQHLETLNSHKRKRDSLMQEEEELLEDLKGTETALEEQEIKEAEVEGATNVNTMVPKREVVFRGATAATGNPQLFDVKSRIKYPMEGGTALITFEDEIVARKIQSLQTHKVTLEGECYITVDAHPVQLMVPTLVQMDTRVCPRSILVSQLPDVPDVDSEVILDKLEIHFGKSFNGGGEVASRHFQEDTRNAVLVFTNDKIALGLTQKENHEVSFPKKSKHKVRVTPFVNGTITRVETKALACPRTVLLTGIPGVMDADCLQDTLEIFFQKGSNGGGEISNALYNPPGQTAVALFDQDTGI
ncbi:interferon-induced protein 35 [Gadus chalcogrammus]|uniref:interferon-induced protein 35 n=1 Tax=Gadus chalcogrammus TaxID=1042646 RepID=UPI0024C2A58B|nr:interferon-induced protein 35 [Gadus chalcogrammus]